jgi:hypothetical protein
MADVSAGRMRKSEDITDSDAGDFSFLLGCYYPLLILMP